MVVVAVAVAVGALLCSLRGHDDLPVGRLGRRGDELGSLSNYLQNWAYSSSKSELGKSHHTPQASSHAYNKDH